MANWADDSHIFALIGMEQTLPSGEWNDAVSEIQESIQGSKQFITSETFLPRWMEGENDVDFVAKLNALANGDPDETARLVERVASASNTNFINTALHIRDDYPQMYAEIMRLVSQGVKELLSNTTKNITGRDTYKYVCQLYYYILVLANRITERCIIVELHYKNKSC